MLKLKDKIEQDLRYIKIMEFINNERKSKIIYPENNEILSSLDFPLSEVKVVILGQDPYHNPEQANGLAFSVSKSCSKIPPSLKNIIKELRSDIQNVDIDLHGDLTCWVNQGVLLLNTSLTVEKNKPNSHSKIGWSDITDSIIKDISDHGNNVVFILWGNNAKEKQKLINNEDHLILSSTHPSPFSANHGFFNSKPFSRTNEYLKSKNKTTINWNII